MVIDTSAVLAVLQNEPERRAFNEAIEAAERRAMSTATFVETSICSSRRLVSTSCRWTSSKPMQRAGHSASTAGDATRRA
jgi:uncharacterized protein with PIN domain